ncbi:MAG: YgfZ/GcvT domain-containing protein [Burkholderiales bacterium]
MDARVSFAAAELPTLGLLSCMGDDARPFLQAQLSSDIEGLAEDRARRAGWCTAKGRLLATMLVVPHGSGYLLQVSRDIAPAVAKRLSMFVLRAKVRIEDVSSAWGQFGTWGPDASHHLSTLGLGAPEAELAIARADGATTVHIASQRFLVLLGGGARDRLASAAVGTEDDWALLEIRDGIPRVAAATQDQFVPQMLNLERLGAVDFKKGCYPGQEIVARTQYRGVLKRRMIRARISAGAHAGETVYADDLPGQAAGMVVNAAGDGEVLVVVPIASLDAGHALHAGAPDGPRLEPLALPYA